VNENMSVVKEYRMTVHLFGATSSPGAATFSLRKLAEGHSKTSKKKQNLGLRNVMLMME